MRAGPLDKLDLAIDRVRCLGRGEPWHADSALRRVGGPPDVWVQLDEAEPF